MYSHVEYMNIIMLVTYCTIVYVQYVGLISCMLNSNLWKTKVFTLFPFK